MTTANTIVCLRADGNDKIGLGHVHRLLALGEILSANFECKFIIRSPLPGIQALIQKNGWEIFEIDNPTLEADECSAFLTGKEIVVLDGYNFDTAYQQTIKNRAGSLVCIDDIYQHHFVSDVIINPSGGLDATGYSKENTTTLFFGPEFSLLKKPFLTAKKNIKRPNNESVLICMGGADPDDHTYAILKYCLNFFFTAFYVVVGEAYAHVNKLNKAVSNLNRNIKILSSLDAAKLVNVMQQCGVSICSASGIAYEYMCVGGELYIKQTAANQENLFNYLTSAGLAFSFEDFRKENDFVNLSVRRQKKIFDGNSGKRILKIFSKLDLDLHAIIRAAIEADLLTTFKWLNDVELRSQSFNTDAISLEDHTAWFKKKINDPFSILYIFEYKNLPIGQIRFEIGEETIISYSIDKDFRGRGWGQLILQQAIKKFQKEMQQQPNKIVGYVKQGNIASNTIFKSLGFNQCESFEYADSYKYELITLYGD